MLIYCMTINETEELARELTNRLTAANIRVGVYHSKLPDAERTAVYQGFVSNQLDIICATSAFGLGIDKPNVRLVVHANMPSSLASYAQVITSLVVQYRKLLIHRACSNVDELAAMAMMPHASCILIRPILAALNH